MYHSLLDRLSLNIIRMIGRQSVRDGVNAVQGDG